MVKKEEAAKAYCGGLNWVGKDGYAYCKRGEKKVRNPNITPVKREPGAFYYVKAGKIMRVKRRGE